MCDRGTTTRRTGAGGAGGGQRRAHRATTRLHVIVRRGVDDRVTLDPQRAAEAIGVDQLERRDARRAGCGRDLEEDVVGHDVRVGRAGDGVGPDAALVHDAVAEVRDAACLVLRGARVDAVEEVATDLERGR